MIKNIKISNKFIGENKQVFIIAEAGVNHNGNLQTALKLVDAAAAASVDAIKFQTFKAEQVVTTAGKMADYQKKNIGKIESQLDMLKKLELSEKFYKPLINHCRKKKIIFLSTPHGGFESIDFLQKLKMPVFKLGSGDLTNLPLLKYAAKFKKPMIISTGMATLREVEEAVKTIKKTGNNKIIVLHCTTNYPCPLNEVNLRAMITMKQKLQVLVGYSDHTSKIQVPIMAATLGACLIEKHFTLDKNMSGPDHGASIEPAELKKMVKAIRETEKIMGSGIKKPTTSELPVMEVARKSIVARINIFKETKISSEMLTIKRPGIGIEPKYIRTIIGKIARKNIEKGILIARKDLK